MSERRWKERMWKVNIPFSCRMRKNWYRSNAAAICTKKTIIEEIIIMFKKKCNFFHANMKWRVLFRVYYIKCIYFKIACVCYFIHESAWKCSYLRCYLVNNAPWRIINALLFPQFYAAVKFVNCGKETVENFFFLVVVVFRLLEKADVSPSGFKPRQETYFLTQYFIKMRSWFTKSYLLFWLVFFVHGHILLLSKSATVIGRRTICSYWK